MSLQDLGTALTPASRLVYDTSELLEAVEEHAEPRAVSTLYLRNRRVRNIMHRSIHLQHLLYPAPEPQISEMNITAHIHGSDYSFMRWWFACVHSHPTFRPTCSDLTLTTTIGVTLHLELRSMWFAKDRE